MINNHHFNFKGRADRKEYAIFFTKVILFLFIGVAALFSFTQLGVIIFYVCALLSLLIIVPSIALIARRLHDIGFTRWLAPLPCISPILSTLAIIGLFDDISSENYLVILLIETLSVLGAIGLVQFLLLFFIPSKKSVTALS